MKKKNKIIIASLALFMVCFFSTEAISQFKPTKLSTSKPKQNSRLSTTPPRIKPSPRVIPYVNPLCQYFGVCPPQ